jgi:hypothetical protein
MACDGRAVELPIRLCCTERTVARCGKGFVPSTSGADVTASLTVYVSLDRIGAQPNRLSVPTSGLAGADGIDTGAAPTGPISGSLRGSGRPTPQRPRARRRTNLSDPWRAPGGGRVLVWFAAATRRGLSGATAERLA